MSRSWTWWARAIWAHVRVAAFRVAYRWTSQAFDRALSDLIALNEEVRA